MPIKSTTEEFIKKAKLLHINKKTNESKYDYSLVKYINAITKVEIICNEHGIFKQKPKVHLDGGGCRKCGLNLTTEELTEMATLIYEGKYDYSKVKYINNKTKIIIICLDHGEFLQNPNSHLCKRGCKKCYIKNKSLTKQQFIKKSNEVHNDEYDYSLVEYKNSNSKVLIICKIHGIFTQTPGSHMAGHRCKKCEDDNKKSNKEKFIELSKKTHGNRYDYSFVNYVNNYTKVTIICKKHGEFQQIPRGHLSGDNCIKCNSSKGEIKIINFLENNSIIYTHQKKFNNCINIETEYKLPFDFCLSDYNLCIEYDGEQHYKPVRFNNKSIESSKKSLNETQINDQIKTDYCLNNNIKLIRIPYWDFKNIEIILEKELNITCLKN